MPQPDELEPILPAYLAEPPRPERPAAQSIDLRGLWVGGHDLVLKVAEASRRERDAGVTSGVGGGDRWSRRGAEPPVFFRLAELSATATATALERWWSRREQVVTVDRLRLRRPEGDVVHGWSFPARLRRSTRWHSVPVVVELRPVHGRWTQVTMTPQTRVLASARYFRIGHLALDRLTERLAAASG